MRLLPRQSQREKYIIGTFIIYTTVGVKLVGMARYGARFVVLIPPFFEWLVEEVERWEVNFYYVHDNLSQT